MTSWENRWHSSPLENSRMHWWCCEFAILIWLLLWFGSGDCGLLGGEVLAPSLPPEDESREPSTSTTLLPLWIVEALYVTSFRYSLRLCIFRQPFTKKYSS